MHQSGNLHVAAKKLKLYVLSWVCFLVGFCWFFFFLKKRLFTVKCLGFYILTAAELTISQLPPKKHAEALYLKRNLLWWWGGTLARL